MTDLETSQTDPLELRREIARLRLLVEEAWEEGYQSGYSDGLTDGHPLSTVWDPDTWGESDAKERLGTPT